MESLTKRQLAIPALLESSERGLTLIQIMEALRNEFDSISQATLTRDVSILIRHGFVERKGHGRASAYRLTPYAKTVLPIDVETYFRLDADKRTVFARFQQGIFELLGKSPLFTRKELSTLQKMKKEYLSEKVHLSQTVLKKEWERVTIEFSWKSSSIEGNTYSLLETEDLLQEGKEAAGKTKEETLMILNHKKALNFVRSEAALFKDLNISLIEHVHSLLVGDLGITKAIRKTLVGITGTRYQPLDNEYQIREAMETMCKLINQRRTEFEKAILAILLISYIQPFEDGNKRTSRLIGNAILIAGDCFPLSFRSVSNEDYKKAILLFYELNNTYAFKELFLKQSEFSIHNYFRSHAPAEN